MLQDISLATLSNAERPAVACSLHTLIDLILSSLQICLIELDILMMIHEDSLMMIHEDEENGTF